ncbi:alpha/beta hydrolase [Neotabrizicola sp. sgz301269]|uniref:alpha/beta hydrolase n=1 Tax=Neotabrizicola sp. sgz301269 TaxID=3276282 RepID=UPI00377067D1
MPSLLALHGAGRDETDLAEFAAAIAPDLSLLAPRGAYPEGQGFTFFRRRPDRSLDAPAILSVASDWLASRSDLPKAPALLIGYSSGAIFAEALIASAPGRFAGAILMRPKPLAAEFLFPPLMGLPVLILAGRHDPRRRSEDAPLLTRQLSAAGARVDGHMLDCGHGWAPEDQDVILSRAWRQRQRAG